MIDFNATLKWGGGGAGEGLGRAAGGRERTSERAKRVSEPTIGMQSAVIIPGGGGASERSERASRVG